jgi:RNA-binding protein
VTRERELNGKQRRHLRALAHDLKPVVQVGVQGLNPGVVSAVDEALTTHELIKVRVGGEGGEPDAVGAELATQTRAHLAQVIGRIAVLYRRRKNKPTLLLPGEKAPKERAGANLQRTATRAKQKKRKAKAKRLKKKPEQQEEE